MDTPKQDDVSTGGVDAQSTCPVTASSFPKELVGFFDSLTLGWNQGSEAEALATKQARRLRERLKRVHSRLRRPLPPKRVLLRDKLAFVLGVMLCMYARSLSCIMIL